jgi:hypothetical protein
MVDRGAPHELSRRERNLDGRRVVDQDLADQTLRRDERDQPERRTQLHREGPIRAGSHAGQRLGPGPEDFEPAAHSVASARLAGGAAGSSAATAGLVGLGNRKREHIGIDDRHAAVGDRAADQGRRRVQQQLRRAAAALFGRERPALRPARPRRHEQPARSSSKQEDSYSECSRHGISRMRMGAAGLTRRRRVPS